MPTTGRIVWDEVEKRFYQTGCDRGVLYRQVNGAYPKAVAWNGLTAVTEQPEGAEPTDIYADNIKYLSIRSAENYKATIEALYSPEEFDECDGSASPIAGVKISQQPRKPFGFSWRTIKGNATEFNDHGYIIHVIYGATVDPTEKSYQTVNDSPDVMNLSWSIDTIPVNVTGYKPTAHMEFDCSVMTDAQVKVLENTLYGKDAHDAIAATYKKATGTYQATGVDYYTKAGDVYTKVLSPSSTDFEDYYVVDTPAQDAQTASDGYLPLPNALIALIQAAA